MGSEFAVTNDIRAGKLEQEITSILQAARERDAASSFNHVASIADCLEAVQNELEQSIQDAVHDRFLGCLSAMRIATQRVGLQSDNSPSACSDPTLALVRQDFAYDISL